MMDEKRKNRLKFVVITSAVAMAAFIVMIVSLGIAAVAVIREVNILFLFAILGVCPLSLFFIFLGRFLHPELYIDED